MKVCFIGVFYYGGPVKHLYTIFSIYKKLTAVFEAIGVECFYFSKQNEILPQDKTLNEQSFYEKLSEFDLVFMWNGGLGKEVEIAKKCRDHGTPVYYMELGWLPQTNTFYFDRKGVNYAGSMLDWQYKPITEQEKKEGRSKLAFYNQNVAKYSNSFSEKDFVFVPFQVESDSQIVNYSGIKTMQQLIDYTTAFIPGNIVYKTHPKDNPGKLVYPKRCKIYGGGQLHDFLENCKYVVTINSTVGVQALTHYKPVITLGSAFYEGRGLTYTAKNGSDFKSAIAKAEENKVAKGRIEAFLCYLMQKQWHVLELLKPEKVLTLIKDLI